ncbi:helix-turn-helix domain-containing protein [Limnobaculum xujianqingii]|nr:helix-turn-helix domain-containing protein [Limnobaculum xujianqingii]
MVGALKLLRPHRGTHPRFDGRLPDKLTRPQPVTYCVLCWRLSLRSERMLQAKQPVPPDAGIRRLSDRYCAEHNPSDPRSRYWTDRRYKDAFERELALLLHDLAMDRQQARKLAYERAHVRKAPPKRSPLMHEKVRELVAQGITQAEIARRLGVSRQAVWKVVKRN